MVTRMDTVAESDSQSRVIMREKCLQNRETNHAILPSSIFIKLMKLLGRPTKNSCSIIITTYLH